MEVKFIGAHYKYSDTVEVQKKQDKIRGYLNKGYKIKDERNGYWVLIKTAQVILTVMDENSQYRIFSVKNKVLELYNKSRISEKTFGKFLSDAKSGKIKFYLTEYDELIIQ